MITLTEMYEHADLNLILMVHPNWEFFRNDQGFLCCRSKNGKKEEAPAVGSARTPQI